MYKYYLTYFLIFSYIFLYFLIFSYIFNYIFHLSIYFIFYFLKIICLFIIYLQYIVKMVKFSNNNSKAEKATVNEVGGINITSKSGFYNTPRKVQDHIFSNPYLIGFILIVALVFIGYAIYYYINTLSTMVILANSSYYGKDITIYEPLFKETENTINDWAIVYS